MITQDKNCFRSQDGAVIETTPGSSVSDYTAGSTLHPVDVECNPPEKKIKTPPSNTFNKFYFFD